MTDELDTGTFSAEAPLMRERVQGQAIDGRRRGLIVAGMHRSGTSAVARVLGLLGTRLPRHSGAAAADNETGFWEPLSIVALDEELLESAGSSWDAIQPIPGSWFASDSAAQLKDRALRLVVDEYGTEDSFVLKDPRICRIVPFWKRVFEVGGIRPAFVIPIRSPLEVAASLKRRNGFSTSRSLLLWLGHMLDVELATRDDPRVFVAYHDLLRNWRSDAGRVSAELGVSWSRNGHDAHAQIDRFLSDRHRHHVYADHELAAAEEVATWVKRAYATLLSFASIDDQQTSDQFDVLDAVRSEFLDADVAFGPLLAETSIDLAEHRAVAEALRGDLERVEAAFDELRAERESAAVEHGRVVAYSATLERELAEGRGLLHAAEQSSAALQQSTATLQRRLDEAAVRARALEDELEQLGLLQVELDHRAERAEERAFAAEGQAAELERDVEAIRQLLDDTTQRAAVLEDELEQSREQRLLAEQAVSSAHADRDHLAAELERGRMHSAAAAAAFAALEAELSDEREVSAAHAVRSQELEAGLVLERVRADARDTQLGSVQRELERVRAELALQSEILLRHQRESQAAVDRARAADERRRQAEAEIIRFRGAAVDLRTELEARTVRGRLASLRRYPRAKGRAVWSRRASPWLRLRLRYASQMLSWIFRHSPRRSASWIHAYFVLRHSGLFDYRFYVMRYPDVVRARVNPLMHYIEHGAREGRDPSPNFSTNSYVETHPEIGRRRNPLMDYRRALRRAEPGVVEGRSIRSAASDVESVALLPAGPHTRTSLVDVICLPVIDWNYRFQRPQQLLTRFAIAGHRAFYAETRFHEASGDLVVSPLAAGVWSLALPGPSELVLYRDELREADLDRIVEAFARFRASLDVEHAIVIVDLPFWRPLALELRRRFGWRVVYDCMDDHAGFLDRAAAQSTRARIHANEEILVRESDAVLASSRELYDRVEGIARKTLLVPNATDFDHFSGEAGERPTWLRDIRHPVVGYYGAISAWFDVELVEEAARIRPEWSFVLVGSTFGADVSRLAALPNVVLPGERGYDEMPAILEQFDVACIPFLLNALTRATNPVKFYEYLSRGKPVVSVPLPELEPYREHFYQAQSGVQLVAQVERALVEDSPAKVKARVDLARRNTWEERFGRIEPLVRSWYGRVAIVIVSFDNADFLKRCLESVWERTTYPDFEVIVVENGTDVVTSTYLTDAEERHERLRVLRPGENLGFARANNLGVRSAPDCEFVVFLNDDTIVTDDWLDRLVWHLQDETVGIVGPVTNWAGNEARIDVGYADDLVGLDAFAAAHTSRHRGETFELPVLAMYCVAVRRELFERFGGLDERYEVGMFEDDDFAMSVRDAGLRVVCAEDVFVHHWGRASFRRLDDDEYTKVFEHNRVRFEEKWQQEWVPHQSR